MQKKKTSQLIFEVEAHLWQMYCEYAIYYFNCNIVYTINVYIIYDYFPWLFYLNCYSSLVSNHIFDQDFAFLYVIFMMSQIMAHS